MPRKTLTLGDTRIRIHTDLKLAARIHQRYRDQGEAAGLAYAVQLVRQMPHLAEKLYALMPPTRAQTIRRASQALTAAREEGQAARTAPRDAQQARVHQAEQTRTNALKAGLEAARHQADAIPYLAGLKPVDRDRLATKDERRAAIALRQTGMLKGKVLAALGCTATELERWHADGRLPHLFTRTLPVEAAGKALPCRFWAAQMVQAAVSQVEGWRARDREQSGSKARKGGRDAA